VTLKHDDVAQQFKNRMALDQCVPKLSYEYSTDGKSITGATLTTNGNTCSAPVPVSFPGQASTSSGGVTYEQLGDDTLTAFATLSGSPVTFTLGTPIAVL